MKSEIVIKSNWVVTLVLTAVFVFVGPISARTEPVDDLILMTESLPPLNFQDNGMLKGISVDLMEKMLKIVGSELTRKDIQLMPWARAYRNILNIENTVLFLMNRNRARENLFKWVGPVIPIDYVLIAKKERGIRINSADDLKKYRIGVVSKDLSELIMKEMNIDAQKIESVPSGEINLMKLNRNRIDLWNYEANGAKWLITQHGHKVQDYEIVYVLKKKTSSYFAFHRNTADAIVFKFQDALDELKIKSSETELSELDKIVQNYKNDIEAEIETVYRPEPVSSSNSLTTPALCSPRE